MADITITIPSITNIPNYNTDTQEQFTENALLSLQQQQTFSAALNTFATQANSVKYDINQASTVASNAAATSEAQAIVATSKASESGNYADVASSAAAEAILAINPVLEAQAQTNALLGLGIGGSTINSAGELIMTYNDATVTSIAFNAVGELILTY
jgi:hypothetical protein